MSSSRTVISRRSSSQATESAPLIPPRESFSCASVPASSSIPSASASGSEILPAAKALRVNSPASARLAPAANAAERTARVTRIPPWQQISTVSSPVNEFGAAKRVQSPVSTRLPSSGLTISPKTASLGAESDMLLPFILLKIRSPTVFADGPDMRISATPPLPPGVDIAAIVLKSVAKGMIFTS